MCEKLENPQYIPIHLKKKRYKENMKPEETKCKKVKKRLDIRGKIERTARTEKIKRNKDQHHQKRSATTVCMQTAGKIDTMQRL